jgi:hypothetical protein
VQHFAGTLDMDFYRGTRLEIDLKAIASNLMLVRQLAGDSAGSCWR